jgi:hypothetical protein
VPPAVVAGVLGYLGLELPADHEIVAQRKRLADELNARWIDAYRLQDAKQ